MQKSKGLAGRIAIFAAFGLMASTDILLQNNLSPVVGLAPREQIAPQMSTTVQVITFLGVRLTTVHSYYYFPYTPPSLTK
jgi:hypothetical protein